MLMALTVPLSLAAKAAPAIKGKASIRGMISFRMTSILD
jgi:hypothetical protein